MAQTKNVLVLSAQGHYIAELTNGSMRIGMREGQSIDFAKDTGDALYTQNLASQDFEEIDRECARILSEGAA